MSVTFRGGSWCDVVSVPDGFAHVYVNGATVTCFIDGPRWTVAAPEPLLFCRAALHNGDVLSIHQGNHSGTAWLVGHSRVQDLGLTHGVQPVAIDDTYAYVVRSGSSYDRIRLDNGAVDKFDHGVPGSSQGISDVLNGVVWWADVRRSLISSGLTLTYPNIRGDVIVGQADPPQIAGVATGHGKFTAFTGFAFEPHVAQSGSRYAICARTPRGAAYIEVPPYPPFVGTQKPPPIDPPPPPKEPKPMGDVFATLKTVRAKYPNPIPQATLRETLGAILNEVAWIHRAEGVGLESKPDENSAIQPRTGRTIGKDILRFAGNIGRDVLNASGAGVAEPVWGEPGPADPTRFVAPVQPLGTGPVDPPPPTGTHAFAGTGRFCTDCGKLAGDPIHGSVQPGGGISEARVREIVREMIGQARITV